MIIGDSAAPGGQLFSLVVLAVAANFGGYLISLTTLPRLIGMLLVGILFQVGTSFVFSTYRNIELELFFFRRMLAGPIWKETSPKSRLTCVNLP